MLPKVDVHGAWVKKRGVPGLGRIAYQESPGIYWVVWEPTGNMGAARRQSASRCPVESLLTIPLKPEPWYNK